MQRAVCVYLVVHPSLSSHQLLYTCWWGHYPVPLTRRKQLRAQWSSKTDDHIAACLHTNIFHNYAFTDMDTHLVVATSTCRVPAEFAQMWLLSRNPLLEVFTNLYWSTRHIEKLIIWTLFSSKSKKAWCKSKIALESKKREGCLWCVHVGLLVHFSAVHLKLAFNWQIEEVLSGQNHRGRSCRLKDTWCNWHQRYNCKMLQPFYSIIHKNWVGIIHEWYF